MQKFLCKLNDKTNIAATVYKSLSNCTSASSFAIYQILNKRIKGITFDLHNNSTWNVNTEYVIKTSIEAQYSLHPYGHFTDSDGHTFRIRYENNSLYLTPLSGTISANNNIIGDIIQFGNG